jgi:hypothetical protein
MIENENEYCNNGGKGQDFSVVSKYRIPGKQAI